ncbi:ThuA domain-containing protein [Telluribacter sp. SYSU D00476]|uniref:ThuA domain-containing protein n=1 Tax=Telluribacter sp. SYSU D00476 TaxID=2811430 RepID=UPI001FF0EB50|nr:ThuA domain-containing protein [Telluribacter sp. SYSU D00476]
MPIQVKRKRLDLRWITGLFLLVLAGLSAAFVTRQQPTQKQQPLVVFVTGDHEYSGEQTLPLLAAELEKNYGLRTKVLKASPNQNAEQNIPGLEALAQADMAVFFLRWRQLPPDQLKHIDAYLNSGKPVMGFRTSTHAFNFPKGHESEVWNAFGERAFGTPPGWGRAGHTHYGHESTTDVTIIPEAAKHPILTGVAPAFHVPSWLYRVRPDYPPKDATLLLMGKSVNPDKAAIENPVAWTWKNKHGAKVFFTTLGHPEDFKDESLQRMTVNAIHWLLDKPVPKKWKGKIDIDVPYRGIVK